MKLIHTATIFSFAALSLLRGSTAAAPPANNPDPVIYSSSLPEAPGAVLSSKDGISWGPATRLRLHTSAFSGVAVGVTLGADGLGFQLATPLATKINLRVNTSFLNYNPSLVEQGIPIDGSIKFRSIGAGVDIYPYRNTFHITPGFTFYNGNTADATVNIAPGGAFTINDTNYTSSYTDPVHGTFDMSFGRKIAPSLTVGFGNMLRRDTHWSIPSEFGFQYIGQPKFVLNMQGSVCDVSDGCTAIMSDPGTVANLQQEQADINKDIAPLRFYPIAKVGLSYRFGHVTKMSLWR
jgi:hypothetical protein